MAREREVQLGVVECPGGGVQQAGADEDGEAGQGRQRQNLEAGLECDRALEEERSQSVAGQGGDLEPDEQVEQVGGQRGPDQRGEQQLEQAGVPAQFPGAQAAELRHCVHKQDGADDGRGQREDQAKRIRGERDAQGVAVYRGPQAEVMRSDQPRKHTGGLEEQYHGGPGQRDQPGDHGKPTVQPGGQWCRHRPGNGQGHREWQQRRERRPGHRGTLIRASPGPGRRPACGNAGRSALRRPGTRR